MGYRLRVVPSVPLDAATYGSGTYGDGTYGQRATDVAADLQNYEVVPTSTSADALPTMYRREHDTMPAFECWLIAFGSQFEATAGVIMDISTVGSAALRLARVTGQPHVVDLEMTKNEARNTLARAFTEDDITVPGTYRLTIILAFLSGRRMTVPVDDSLTITVADAVMEEGT